MRIAFGWQIEIFHSDNHFYFACSSDHSDLHRVLPRDQAIIWRFTLTLNRGASTDQLHRRGFYSSGVVGVSGRDFQFRVVTVQIYPFYSASKATGLNGDRYRYFNAGKQGGRLERGKVCRLANPPAAIFIRDELSLSIGKMMAKFLVRHRLTKLCTTDRPNPSILKGTLS